MSGEKTFVYVGNSDSQDISVFALHEAGELAPLATVPMPKTEKPGGSLPLAVSPDKTLLFAAVRAEPYALATFAIDPQSGALTLVGTGPLADSMCSITTDRSGRYILGASYGGNKISVGALDTDGVVGETLQIVATQPNAHCVIVDPGNRFVLNSSLGGDVVHQHRFDAATGALSPNDPPVMAVKPKGGPRHLTFSPDQRFVYLLNELDAALYVFPYDAARGTLGEAVQVASALPPDFAGTPWGADIHVTPNGAFLYASERTTSTIAAFRVDTTSGRLTFIANYPTEQQPRGFAIDGSGRYLIAAGQLSHSVTVYAIEQSSGVLKALGRYATGQNPNWVEIVTP